jgi:hypothetical protein
VTRIVPLKTALEISLYGIFPMQPRMNKGVIGEGDSYEKKEGSMVFGFVWIGVSWMLHSGK